MAQLKEISIQGVEITDEAVACTDAVTISEITYYRGYLLNTANPNIQGNTSATHGVWTAAAKGGSRLTVQLVGVPADADHVWIDTLNGHVYSTTSRTLYVRYLAHEPIYFTPRYMQFSGCRDFGALASAPTDGAEKDTYYNTTDHKRYTHNGTGWQAHW